MFFFGDFFEKGIWDKGLVLGIIFCFNSILNLLLFIFVFRECLKVIVMVVVVFILGLFYFNGDFVLKVF